MKTSAGLGRYRILLALLAPALAAHCAWMALRNRDPRYLRQRLGLFTGTSGDQPIWIHAASVGEVNAAAPLAAALAQRHPGIPLLVTTSTPSGAQVAGQRLPAGTSHAYLPIDWPGAVSRFLKAHRPRCALIMETELWPNLYSACAARDIPLIVVNGRLSPRTLGAPSWVRRLYRHCLGMVRAVLARSEQDRAGFVTLGAAADRCQTIGNIKFAALNPDREVVPMDLGRPYVLAASTRDEEEKAVVSAWRAGDRRGRLLVIAPRHPKRRAKILADIAPLGARVAVRSRGDEIGDATGIYLADTFGELERFMAGAELVFMGGSLVPKGGHNILEPAALGKPVVFGPHMDNFLDEAALFLRFRGAIQVRSATELGEVFGRLLAAPKDLSNLGQSARALVLERRDMAQRYVDAIESWCPLDQPSP